MIVQGNYVNVLQLVMIDLVMMMGDDDEIYEVFDQQFFDFLVLLEDYIGVKFLIVVMNVEGQIKWVKDFVLEQNIFSERMFVYNEKFGGDNFVFYSIYWCVFFLNLMNYFYV